MAKPLVIDFTNVEEGGFAVPNGKYVVKVKKIEQKTSAAGAAYFNWELMILQGPHKGKKLFHITSLKAAALFNLRNTLIALGVPVPKGKLKLDLKALIGKIMGVTVVNEQYEGKDRPKIKDTFPVTKEGNQYVSAADAYEDPTDEESDEEEEEEETEDEEEDDEEDDED